MTTAWLRPFRFASSLLPGWRRRFGGASERRELAVQRIVAHLGRLHGLSPEMGEIIASAELDSDSRHFAPLPEPVVVPLPRGKVRRLLARRLGRRVNAVFAELSDKGVTASLAQVHRARLPDGQIVAVKLLLPAIADTIREDLAVLGWLAAPPPRTRTKSDRRDPRATLATRLHAELDTAQEAAWLQRFGGWTETAPDLVVPRVIEELLRPDLLVLTWVDGESIEVARTWPVAVRQQLANTLARLVLEELLVWRALHADPHPDNYRFLQTGPQGGPAVGLLDFGSVHEIPPAAAEALTRVIQALCAGALTPALAWELHRALGFDLMALAPLRDRLPAVLAEVLRPLGHAGAFDFVGWEPEAALAALLGTQHRTYRLAAPPELAFLARTWDGLAGYLRALACPVDWGAVFASLALPAPAGTVTPLALAPAIAHAERPLPTTTLHVRVVRDGKERVSLSLPASCLPIIADLVPEDLRPTITQRGIDLPALVARAESTAATPQEVFTLSEPRHTMRVWLE